MHTVLATSMATETMFHKQRTLVQPSLMQCDGPVRSGAGMARLHRARAFCTPSPGHFDSASADLSRTTNPTRTIDHANQSPWPVCSGAHIETRSRANSSSESKNSSQHNQSKKNHRNGYAHTSHHERTHTNTNRALLRCASTCTFTLR